MRAVGPSFGILLLCSSVTGAFASEPVCTISPDDVVFLGRHIATGASGVVFDANPFIVLEGGPGDGVAFVETEVEVLSVLGGKLAEGWPAVGATVNVLQKIPCSRCYPGLITEPGGGAPFSSIGDELWFRASTPGWNLFVNAAAMYGARFDLVIEPPCVPTTEMPGVN